MELKTDLDFESMDFESMSDEELMEFRKQFNPDEMGDIEVEGVED